MAGLDIESEENKKNEEILNLNDDQKSKVYVTERMKTLENIFRTKFANNWTSVRKAFLDTD